MEAFAGRDENVWLAARREVVARVAEKVPGWRVWRTEDFVSGHWTWSAMPDGASVAAVMTDDPGELVDRILDCESWLPDAIREAREKLDSFPAHWEHPRAAWAQQLEALTGAQQRQAETRSAGDTPEPDSVRAGSSAGPRGPDPGSRPVTTPEQA